MQLQLHTFGLVSTLFITLFLLLLSPTSASPSYDYGSCTIDAIPHSDNSKAICYYRKAIRHWWSDGEKVNFECKWKDTSTGGLCFYNKQHQCYTDESNVAKGCHVRKWCKSGPQGNLGNKKREIPEAVNM